MLEEARNLAGLSLEKAAELTYWDRKALRRRETGEIPITPDEVKTLSDVYCNPQLKHWYCSVCEIGKEKGCTYEPIDATLATLRLLKGFKHIPEIERVLMDVLEDGIVTVEELSLLEDVCEKMAYLKQSIDALVMVKEKTAIASSGLR